MIPLKKHILIFFLSEVHAHRETHELSVLTYERKNGEPQTVIQTNETALRALMDMVEEKGEKINCIFYFASSRVKGPFTYKDQQGIMQTTTQQDFFLQRVQREYEDIPCIPISFDETKQPEMGIEQVTNMAQDIMAKITKEQWPIEDVRLHADMTGGPRTAAMMMLSVMQLLKYDGIVVDNVLYSYKNRDRVSVEDATDVYGMFNLVSGADEFVNFGSVEEIERYFENRQQSPELQKLLWTMRDFSDAIRVCSPFLIRKHVNSLKKALDTFEQKENKSLPELLFSKILTVFKKEYAGLLEEPVTRLNIISWCVRKGYLQQAMTMCTEWLPEYIVSHEICYPVDTNISSACTTSKRYDWVSWQQYFINVFVRAHKKKSIPQHPLSKKAIRRRMIDAIQVYRRERNIDNAVALLPGFRTALLQFFNEYDRSSLIFSNYDPYTLENELKKVPYIYRTIWLQWENKKRNSAYKKNFYEVLFKFKINKMWEILETMNADDLSYIFSYPLPINPIEPSVSPATTSDIISPNIASLLQGDNKWKARGKQYHQMFVNGIIGSRYDEETMLTVLKEFFWIRTTRNEMNHASNDNVAAAPDIALRIRSIVERLETL